MKKATQLAPARRISQVPPYLFSQIDKTKQGLLRRGVDVIDLGIGDPDRPTFPSIVQAMQKAVEKPENHNYPPYEGTLDFRQAVSHWYRKRFGVQLDPGREVMALIGSKEGIGHCVFSWIDPGDIALVPDPGYPVYRVCTLLAGGRPYAVPLLAKNSYLPDLESIPTKIAEKARLLFLNYPNNPTAAVASLEFFKRVVRFAHRYGILICSDLAYSEVAFDGFHPPSILQVPGAKEVAIEFHTLSKTYNMTGWRIGMAAGNPTAIQALSVIKTNIDSGQFMAIQEVAARALRRPHREMSVQSAMYAKRRKILIDGLNRMGWDLPYTQATFYVWAPVPPGYTSQEFSADLLEKAGVLVVPGNGYGRYGEGYFRASVTVPEEQLQKVVERLERANIG